MKKLLFILFFVVFASANAHAKAGIPIPACFPCTSMDIVQELPNEDSLKQEGQYLDLGYLYEEYGILFISIWNTDGQYVLCNEDKTIYYELSEEKLQQLKETHKLDVEENPLGLWKKFGGKIILLVLIGIGIFGAFSKSDDEESKEQPKEESK